MSQEPVPPPTEKELDMACLYMIQNTIRGFSHVDESDVTPGEERFLARWRAIPHERREAAVIEYQKQVWDVLAEGFKKSLVEERARKEQLARRVVLQPRGRNVL